MAGLSPPHPSIDVLAIHPIYGIFFCEHIYAEPSIAGKALAMAEEQDPPVVHPSVSLPNLRCPKCGSHDVYWRYLQSENLNMYYCADCYMRWDDPSQHLSQSPN